MQWHYFCFVPDRAALLFLLLLLFSSTEEQTYRRNLYIKTQRTKGHPKTYTQKESKNGNICRWVMRRIWMRHSFFRPYFFFWMRFFQSKLVGVCVFLVSSSFVFRFFFFLLFGMVETAWMPMIVTSSTHLDQFNGVTTSFRHRNTEIYSTVALKRIVVVSVLPQLLTDKWSLIQFHANGHNNLRQNNVQKFISLKTPLFTSRRFTDLFVPFYLFELCFSISRRNQTWSAIHLKDEIAKQSNTILTILLGSVLYRRRDILLQNNRSSK